MLEENPVLAETQSAPLKLGAGNRNNQKLLGDGGVQERISTGRLLSEKNGVSTKAPTKLPSSYRYPQTTDSSSNASGVIQQGLQMLTDKGVIGASKRFMYGALSHEDGSITVALAKTAKAYASQLQKILPKNFRVNTNFNPTSKQVNPNGLKPAIIEGIEFPEGRPFCVECQLSVEGRQNPSILEGMTIKEFGNPPSKYIDPITGEAAPCSSCQVNEPLIMEPLIKPHMKPYEWRK